MTVAESLNLARRSTMRNEPDFLQEDILNDTTRVGNTKNGNTSSPYYTRHDCMLLIDKIGSNNNNSSIPLPFQCTQYKDIVVELQRRKSNTKSNYTIAFEGMSPGEKRDAIAARQSGRLSNAQIQRRLTSNKDRNDKSFFF